MNAKPMLKTRLRAMSTFAVATSLALSSVAMADESIIKHPGQHPHHVAELEPHLTLGVGHEADPFGIGLGFRATFTVLQNGFVPSINNSIGVGVGIDVFGDRLGSGLVPVVMQWNFWLTRRWSVFGEPGIAIGFGRRNQVWPHFAGGARFHFTDRIALTMRVGYPAVTVGVSFFL